MKKYHFHLAPTELAQDGKSVFSSETMSTWQQILDEHGVIAEEPSDRGLGIKVAEAPSDSFVYLMHYDVPQPRDAYITLYSEPTNAALDVVRALASAGYAHMERLPRYVGEDTGPPAFVPGTTNTDEKGRDGICIDTNERLRIWLNQEIGGQPVELSEAQPRVFSHWFFYFQLNPCNPVGCLTEDEIDEVCDVFDEHAIEDPNRYSEGYFLHESQFSLNFDTDNLNCGNPIASLPVELTVFAEEIPDEVLTIILKVAQAGNLALMNSDEDVVCLVECDRSDEGLQKWANASMVTSPVEFRSWLARQANGRRVLGPADNA